MAWEFESPRGHHIEVERAVALYRPSVHGYSVDVFAKANIGIFDPGSGTFDSLND